MNCNLTFAHSSLSIFIHSVFRLGLFIFFFGFISYAHGVATRIEIGHIIPERTAQNKKCQIGLENSEDEPRRMVRIDGRWVRSQAS